MRKEIRKVKEEIKNPTYAPHAAKKFFQTSKYALTAVKTCSLYQKQ